jgi:hypothetical protein
MNTYINRDDYCWYIQAIEKLWNADILSDSQHDRVASKLEKMVAKQKEPKREMMKLAL